MDRCITRGMPGSMLPGAYNSGIDVWQSPGYAVIRTEEIHEARIIPIAGKGPPPPAVKSWMGYSVGHWEGDTLVIETTNFIPGQPIGGNGARRASDPEQRPDESGRTADPDGARSHPLRSLDQRPRDADARRSSSISRGPAGRDYVQYEYACFEGNEQTRGYIEGTSPFEAAKREAREKARDAGTLAATDHDTSSSNK